jgi:putative membrane protein
MMWGYGNGGFFWGSAMMVIPWIVIVVGVVFLARGFRQPTRVGAGADPQDSPLEIIRRRYASGEIGREEFERLREEVGKP